MAKRLTALMSDCQVTFQASWFDEYTASVRFFNCHRANNVGVTDGTYDPIIGTGGCQVGHYPGSTRTDSIEAVARALVNQGWSSLLDAEVGAMVNDEEFCQAVLDRVKQLWPERDANSRRGWRNGDEFCQGVRDHVMQLRAAKKR
jgi:hypothetical protein